MKKIILCVTIIIVFTTFQLSSVADADVITLVADEWCPYNCAPNSETPGFMIEIAQYAFERAGHTIEYTIVPWARAIDGTRSGKYDGIVGAGREETPDFIFPEYALGVAAHTFFVKQGASWTFTGLESLDQIVLGVIKDYSYGDLYDTYIQPHENDNQRIDIVHGETGLTQNIRKLLLGRIDALIEDRTVFQYHLHQTKTPNEFSEAGVAYMEKVYIAFSPQHAHAKDYAEILSQAIPEMRASGKLAEILAKYGVQDWGE